MGGRDSLVLSSKMHGDGTNGGMRVPIKAEKGQAVDSLLLTPSVWPSETHFRYPANILPWGYWDWSLDAAFLERECDLGGGSSPVESNSQSWFSWIPEAEAMCLSPPGGIWAAHQSVHFRSFPPSLFSIRNASPGPPRYKKRRENTREEKHRDTQRKPCEDRAETGLTLPHAQERLDYQKLKSQGRIVL